jgi:hypothetical protein
MARRGAGSVACHGLPRRSATRELIHQVVAERLPRGEVVVEVAQEPRVADGRGAAQATRRHVVELDAERGAADPAALERPLAAASVANPDLPLHVGRDVLRVRRRRLAPRLLHETLPLRVLSEDEIQTGVEDLLAGGAGASV